jgi:hypothetical protein
MTQVVPFLPSHLMEIDIQPAQQNLSPYRADLGRYYHAAGPARSLVASDGRVLLCCGLLEVEGPSALVQPWKGIVWTVIATLNPGEFITAHRTVVGLLAEFGANLKRIEATVSVDHAEGHRWMRALGFRCEASVMRCSGLFGQSDESLYAKVAQ